MYSQALSEASSADFVHVGMEVDKLEKELNTTGDEALQKMMTEVYQDLWAGSKEATIKLMVEQAAVAEIPAILAFAETLDDIP